MVYKMPRSENTVKFQSGLSQHWKLRGKYNEYLGVNGKNWVGNTLVGNKMVKMHGWAIYFVKQKFDGI